MKQSKMKLWVVALGLALSGVANAATITVDGDPSDWGSIPYAAQNPSALGDQPIGIKLTNDANNLYFLLTFASPLTPLTDFSGEINLDSDKNVTTGVCPFKPGIDYSIAITSFFSSGGTRIVVVGGGTWISSGIPPAVVSCTLINVDLGLVRANGTIVEGSIPLTGLKAATPGLTGFNFTSGISLTGTYTLTAAAPPPAKVIFIPGLEASRLYVCDGADEKNVWPAFKSSTFSNLALLPVTTPVGPGQTVTVTSQREVHTRDLVLEGYSNGSGPNIYKSFVAYMDGQFPGGGWDYFPYDWRFGYDQILDQGVTIRDGPQPCSGFRVRNLVNEIESFQGKISIVAHSNGGLLAKRLIQRLVARGTAAKVEKLILVASPQFGTPEAQEILFHGTNFPTDRLAGAFALDPSVVKTVALNMPGAYNMLPSREFFNHPPCTAIGCKTVASFTSLLATDMSLSALASDVNSYDELRSLARGDSPYRCPSNIIDCTDAPQRVNSTLLDSADGTHQFLDSFAPPTH